MSDITLHEEIRNMPIANDNAWLATNEIDGQGNQRGKYRK